MQLKKKQYLYLSVFVVSVQARGPNILTISTLVPGRLYINLSLILTYIYLADAFIKKKNVM